MKVEKHLKNKKIQHLVIKKQDAETFRYRFCSFT
jgi:hypothetical protein